MKINIGRDLFHFYSSLTFIVIVLEYPFLVCCVLHVFLVCCVLHVFELFITGERKDLNLFLVKQLSELVQ